MSVQHLYIDSSDRISGTANNFTVLLRESIKEMVYVHLQFVSIDNQGFTDDIFINVREFNERNFGTNANLSFTFVVQNKNNVAGNVQYQWGDYRQEICLHPEDHFHKLTIRVEDKNGVLIPAITNNWTMLLKLIKK